MKPPPGHLSRSTLCGAEKFPEAESSANMPNVSHEVQLPSGVTITSHLCRLLSCIYERKLTHTSRRLVILSAIFSLHTRAGIKAPMPWPHPSMITSCLCLRVPLGRVMGRGLQKRFTSESAANAGKDQGHRPSSSCHQGSSFQTIKADQVKEAAQKEKEASQGPSWLLCLSFMGSCALELF